MSNKGLFRSTPAVKILLAALVATLIVWVYPREGHFRYSFQEGKPWRYGLLTAPYNYSIYKTDEAFQAEKDSVLAQYCPVIQQNVSILDQTVEQLSKDYDDFLRATTPSYYLPYLLDQFDLIYSAGIIDADTYNGLLKQGVSRVMLVSNGVAQQRQLTSIFTAKRAYEAILQNLPENIDRSILSDCHLDNYLTENCLFDENSSEQMREDLLHTVSRTSGMVQKGERIIDQGEIVGHEAFLKLDSLRRHAQERNLKSDTTVVLVGQILWVALMLGLLLIFLQQMRPNIWKKFSHLLFILLLVTFMALFSALVIRNDEMLNLYMIPYAILPILICTFFDSRTAFFTHVIMLFICAPISPFPFEFLMLQIPVGMVTIFSLKNLTQRSQLAFCILLILASYITCYLALSMLQEGAVNLAQWKTYTSFGINALLLLSSYLLIYLFEWTFRFTSNVTLMELANINSPLLREFSEKCPGTFQHSLQVSNLAAAAAQAIGANAESVRAGALYHDLGKMNSPEYFTENQDHGENPLNSLSTEQAVSIITNHVSEGLKLAGQHHLPKVIKDYISTHHGHAPVRYFYTLWRNANPEGEAPAFFFYPGPNPLTREEAILMMADTVEAASKSLKKYDEKGIEELVGNLIGRQISEGYFKDVPITFQEVECIKRVFRDKLLSIYHTRIAYPKAKA